jgi:stress response protein YsnF
MGVDKELTQTGKVTSSMSDEKSPYTIPLSAEELLVTKRTVATGKVRIKTVVDKFEEVAREDLKTERIEAHRVGIGKEIETIPSVRTEGDTTIIPVVEEVLVIEKRLVLKEEIHIRRIISKDQVEVPVTVRKQRAVVERDDVE